METKKFDIKTWVIIILGIALCISFWFGQRNKIDNHKDEIKVLHELNNNLKLKNDSLSKANMKLDIDISNINKSLKVNEFKLVTTQIELDKLKKRKNEIYSHVINMSANDISNAFTNFLNTKSTNTR